MGWNTVLQDALAAAATILGDGLMATVQHEPYASQNAYGEPTYGAAVNRRAVVVDQDAIIRKDDATEIVAHTRVTFLTPVAVDTKDRITLPDGRQPTILRVDFGVRADDGSGFTTEVWC